MIGNIRSIIEKYAFSQSAVDVNGDLCEKEYIVADGVSTILARAIENKILPYIDSLQEEPVSEDLKKAADNALESILTGID